ncbi:hypothetical protein OAM26_03975 [Porticoccaceae bacterium]|nr:hypothetical protein [Porticoccaceae bacterium]
MIQSDADAVVASLNAKEPLTALEKLSPLLAQEPDNGSLWDYQLAALVMADRHIEAEQAFQRCQQLGIAFTETLANACTNAKKLLKPELVLARGKQLEHLDKASGLKWQVEALLELKQGEAAKQAAERLLQIANQGLSCQHLAIQALRMLGDETSALGIVNRALIQNPADARLTSVRIELCVALGETTKALEIAQQWTEKYPERSSAKHLSSLCFHSQYPSQITVAQRRERAEQFANFVCRDTTPYTSWKNNLEADRPLRIGLLSGDLRSHPIGYFIHPLLEGWQRTQLSVFVYDTLEQGDQLSAQMRPLTAAWHKIKHVSDEEVCKQIRSDKIDILIDLHGHTTGQRLRVMALKPAPVSATWIGFQSTTGLAQIDYILVDPISVPEGAEDEFVEKVWRLDNYFCFAPPQFDLPVGPPPQEKNGYTTFGSLNNPKKITDEMLALWCKVLNAVPNSRLFIKGTGLEKADFRASLQRRLLIHGFTPEQVTLEGAAPREQFLASYQKIDIALDPFPYSGATTTVEALWCGLPVIALAGDRMVWRMAKSILTQAGHPEWVAEDQQAFVELAANLASDPEKLAQLRVNQRDKLLSGPLFDANNYSQKVGASLRRLWADCVAKSMEGV